MNLYKIIKNDPNGIAKIHGTQNFSDINGVVRFYQTSTGVVVYAEINGLPNSGGNCESKIFGFHIHEGGSCTGTEIDLLANTLNHFDLHGCSHPNHSGDMPPLFGNNGYAFLMFLTNRFEVSDIIGKTVVIHSSPDDFKTQPSGNAGTKIACGVIDKIN